MKSHRKTSLPHIVLAGGSSGGHLFPALAVAEQLRAMNPSLRITLSTGHKLLERQHVVGAGFDHLRLRSRPLPDGLGGAWRFLADNMSGYREARRFVWKENVTLVVGMGGHASLPMAAAAARMRLPLVLVEQNSVAGRVNRWLAPQATLVCIAFEEARAQLKAHGPIRVTGVPIRAASVASTAPLAKRMRDFPAGLRLLVLGGSGRRAINEEVPKSLYKLRSRFDDWQIVHRSGSRDQAATAALYRKLGLSAMVVPSLDPIQPMLRHASLVVSRSSGSTLAELAAAATPAVLLPSPHASSDHQRKNADVLARCGAARVVDERQCSGRLDDAVAEALDDLLVDAAKRRRMAAAMGKLARSDAAWHIATMANDLAGAVRLHAAA